MQVRRVSLCLAVLAFLAYANSESLDKRETPAKKVSAFFHSLPRVNFKGHSAPKTFDAGDKDYLEGLGVIALPFVCIGVACLIVFPIVFGLRFCAKRCGAKPKKSGYTQSEVSTIQSGLVILSILVIINASIGIAATYLYHRALVDAVDELYTTSSSLHKQAGSILSLMEEVSQTNDALSNLQKDSKKVMDDTSGSKEESDLHVVLGYDIYMYTAYGAALLASVAATIAAARRMKEFAGAALVFGFIAMILLWIAAGANLASLVGASDLCEYPLDKYTVDQSSGSNREYMMWFVYCDSSVSNPFTHDIQQEEEFVEQEKAKNNTEAAEIGTEIIDKLTTLADCSDTKKAFDNLDSYVCIRTINDIFIMTLTQVLSALLLFALLIVAMLAIKRFSIEFQYTQLDPIVSAPINQPTLFDSKALF